MSDQPTSTTQVRGYAVYLEFVRALTPGVRPSTFQLLITPEGFSAHGTYVPMTVFYRTLTPTTPKRPWSTSRVNPGVASRLAGPDQRPVPLTDHEEYTKAREAMTTVADPLFDQLNRQGYGLYKQPIVVEVSNVDLDQLGKGNTAYALVRRVMSSRKHLGFPEDLVREPAATTPTASV